MTTVLCHGVFDVVHPGHLEHFRQAKQIGDKLIVAVVGDAHVRKGPGRPMFDQERRANFLRALDVIDDVVIVDSPLAMPVLETMKPDVFCKGADYLNPDHQFAAEFQKEKTFVENYGGKVILTNGFTASSTAIIRQIHQSFPALEPIRHQYGFDGVMAWMDRGQKAHSTVIGEDITDEYIYVRPLFKSAKDNIVAFEPIGSQSWRGGAAIVEEDLRQFTASVKRVTNGPAVHKLRYVDDAFNQKLFSVIEQPSLSPLQLTTTDFMCELLVVADYGHGLINRDVANTIVGFHEGFLALTVQSNSANWGFNLLTKWPRAHYIVVDRNELELACGDRQTPIEELACRMRHQMDAVYFAVTLGHEGCLVVTKEQVAILPALNETVVDRMGAGDAFLAATAPLAWAGAPAEIIALVGNVAGAIKVGKLGNQPITRPEVETRLRELLT